MNENIKIAWWNTALSPPKSNSRSNVNGNIIFAKELIEKLITEHEVDIICLCEVNQSDIDFFKTNFIGTNFSIIEGAGKAGRTHFDFCTIYNHKKLIAKYDGYIIRNILNKTLKIGQQIDFSTSNSTTTNEANFSLILSHWPSQRTYHSTHPQRRKLASNLKFHVESLVDTGTQYVVLMGDYNDEPYSTSIEEELQAVRDIELARDGEGYLYNPTWRYLGNHISCTDITCGTSHINTGTIYYPAGDYTKWNVYDQMIFTKGFLDGGGWKIKDLKINILSDDSISSKIRSNSIFDHLPIMAEIHR